MSSPSILRLTLGTAGHIDHGKTSLVRALVGEETQTDRLAEERERGLTIDIGYAEWRLPDGTEIGIVDVPGHEKFIRNMVAGATGMDCVLLAVAADDGAMPQTREHLQIMTLLGMSRGVVAITKVDLVEPLMRELVEDDLRTLLQSTFLADAPIFPVSSVTGEGVEELRGGLESLLRATPPRDAEGPFRMPVQRVFTVKGYGTVATGIPLAGTVRRDDKLELLPVGRTGRVRGIQVYHQDADVAGAGHRTALNLADIEYQKVHRGDVLAEPGLFKASNLFDLRFRCTIEGRKPLDHNTSVRMHVGTAESVGRLMLVEGDRVASGEEVYAQVRLDEPIVAAPGDRFILRLPSPAVTVGGGTVLGDAPRRRPRRRESTLVAMREREAGLDDPRTAVKAALRTVGSRGADVTALSAAVKRRAPEVRELLASLVESGEAVAASGELHLLGSAWEEACESVEGNIDAFHERHRMRDWMRLAELRSSLGLDDPVVDAAVRQLGAAGRLETAAGGRVRRAGHEASLSDEEAGNLARLDALLQEEGFATPREDEIPLRLGVGKDEAASLLSLLVERGDVLRLREGVVLHRESVDNGKRCVAERIRESGSVAPADLKEMLGATRKYGIPFLEHLDSTGFTVRVGDRRELRGG